MSSFAPPDPYDCQDCDNNARAVWAIKNPQLYVLPQKAVWHRRFRVETIPLFIGFLARRLFYLSHYICREIDAAEKHRPRLDYGFNALFLRYISHGLPDFLPHRNHELLIAL